MNKEIESTVYRNSFYGIIITLFYVTRIVNKSKEQAIKWCVNPSFNSIHNTEDWKSGVPS